MLKYFGRISAPQFIFWRRRELHTYMRIVIIDIADIINIFDIIVSIVIIDIMGRTMKMPT